MEVPSDDAGVHVMLGAEGAAGVLPGLLPLTRSPARLECWGILSQRPPETTPGKAQEPSMADTCWPGSQGPSSISDAAPW